MENTLKYLNVGSKKDETQSAQYSKVPNVVGQSSQKHKIVLKEKIYNLSLLVMVIQKSSIY